MSSLAQAPIARMRVVEIGEVARGLNVTTRTLRHYQDQGLIRSHRLARNVRGYDVDTVEQLKAIVALRSVGLPISAIRAILILRDEPDAQIQALRSALAEALNEQRAQLGRLVALAEHLTREDGDLPPAIAGLGQTSVEVDP